MEYRRDDEGIRGFCIYDRFVCRDCIEDEELEEMTEQGILTDDDIGEGNFICARCKSKL